MSGVPQRMDQHEMGVRADAVLRLGMMLMGAGASGYRVIRGMKRAARALGFVGLDAVVTITTITCTFHEESEFRTVVAHQPHVEVDASRIEALESLAHRVRPPMSAQELTAELDAIEAAVRKRWGPWLLAVAAACACAGCAALNGFGPVEVAVVAVAAAVGQAVRGWLGRRGVQMIAGVAAGGAAACASYAALVPVAGAAEAGFVASVLFLVPGFPLFSALIDLARCDIAAGVARLTYAMTVMASAAFAVTATSWAMRLSPQEWAGRHPGYGVVIPASAVGIAGFALLFNSSRRMALAAASIGTVGNAVRWALIDASLTPFIATCLGALVVGLLGFVVVRLARIPRVTTTVPAVVVMIPGPAMYRALHGMGVGDVDAVVSHSATAAMTVLSIGAGLVLARLCTDRDWALGRPIDFSRYR
ncbi:Inner membrane protein YjjP [Corynebacterium oculi]|uniref:Inner membrane protein YjjP n=2 Tax=Corynebacterium oculi TaxID=1544416 RepID=A0A0Q0TW53_9CORY|nr:Inner membrane protein YjjP [Corynebacterium oculi]